LLPGAYAEVAFSIKGAMAALRVPANALLFRAEGPMVAVVGEDGRARLQRITIGRDFGAQLEIVGGLRASDRVIVNPPDGIREGDKLRVIPAATAKT
jgi:membrane fusion protein (multidrug efflux system)